MSFAHHLHATPDVLGAGLGATIASLNMAFGYVTTSDSSGADVRHRHFGYASAAGAALWAAGNAQTVIRSYTKPARDREIRRLERVLICSGIAAMGLYTHRRNMTATRHEGWA